MAMVGMLSQQIHMAALVVEGVLQVEPLEATTVEAEVAVEGLAAAEAVDLPTKHRSLASVRIAFARPALLRGLMYCLYCSQAARKNCCSTTLEHGYSV